MEEGFVEATEPGDGKHFRSTRKLPGIQLFSMSLAIVVESCHITICYTIGVYMVHRFMDNSADESQIGTLTGLLSSFYSLAQLTTAFAWGMVSDRYGRKQLIVMSNLFSTISMLMFGLSGNYTVAAISRVIGGWFNCSFTNVRSMIGESTDFSSQTVAMGYLGTAFGVGVILGPLIGGALAYPCDNFGSGFPLCGANQLNAQRPFLLPCLGAALISAVATLSNIFVLTETLPRVVEARAAAHAAKQQDEEKPLLGGEQKPSASEPEVDIEDTLPVRSLPQKVGRSPQDFRSALAGHADSKLHAEQQSIPGAQHRTSSFQSKISLGASPDDVPWFQVGTPFLVSTEVSASVADDIVEYQHYRRDRMARSVPDQEPEEPHASAPKSFLRRLASEAAVPSLEAADVESDTFDPYDARGGRAARRLPTPTRHMQRTARRPAPARVSLLSRSLPEGRSSALASAFAAPEEQDASEESQREHSARSGTEYYSQASSEAPYGVSPAAGESGEVLPVEPDGTKADGAQEQAESPDDKWYKDPVVLLGVAGYTMICFMFNMLDELTPIFAAAPISRGGLDFSSSQLSLPLSISGVALMVWSLVFFPMVQRCLGARTCAVFGLAATVFLSVALGCTSYLAQAHTSVSGIIVALTVIMVLKACFQQLCFPTSMAIVNRFAPPSKRGAVNGTAQSLASGVRALGPFLGGLMWAVFSGLPAPGSQLIPFFIISLTAAGTITIYYFLPAI